MFSKVGAELSGTAELLAFVPPSADIPFIARGALLEGERMLIALKSKRDELIFTDRCLLHIDGESATSSKKTLTRRFWHNSRVSNVVGETAGTLDRDAEVKFTVGDKRFDLDIAKAQTGAVLLLVSCLTEISLFQEHQAILYEMSKQALAMGKDAICSSHGKQAAAAAAGGAGSSDPAALGSTMLDVATKAQQWMTQAHAAHIMASPAPIMERYAARIYSA